LDLVPADVILASRDALDRMGVTMQDAFPQDLFCRA
jgi:hypothetical protein